MGLLGGGNSNEILYENRKYVCGYCTYTFEQAVRRLETGTKRGNVSTQVVCPHCKNFLKTWDDGEKIGELVRRIK